MIDDLAMAETGETADDQARICRPQPLDGLFHVPFFFSVPTGDLCIGLYQKVRSIEIKSCLPSGPDGFQADIIRDTAEHSLHSLLRLPHKAQRPCRHVLFVCRSILLLRHDLQNQSIQHSEIQILRPAEDHPIDLNGWGSLQKNSRSAAQRLCKKQIQLSVKLFFNISGQLVRLIPGSRVGRFTGSIKAVEADGIHAEFPFQQRDQILKLLPAHKISVQQHHGLSLYIAESFDLHANMPPRYYRTFMQKSQRSLPRPSVMVLSQISFGCSPV